MVYSSELNFPAVTICNLNPIRQAAMLALSQKDENVRRLNETVNDMHAVPTQFSFLHFIHPNDFCVEPHSEPL